MKLITGLLERYRNLVAPDAAVKEAVSTLIKERWRTEVPPTAISVRNGTLFITGSSALKSEVALQKKEVLQELQHRTGKTFSDIR